LDVSDRESQVAMNIQQSGTNADTAFKATERRSVPLAIGDFGMATMYDFSSDLASSATMLRRAPATPGNRTAAFALKRIFDVVVASILIVLLSPVLLAVALAVKLTSRGPVLFSQRRWGRGNTPFRLYKFRSMYVELEDKSGIAQTVANDPRVTAVGRFIRRTSLDELPQLFNVLKGDMSLVGPRAHVLGMHAAGVRYEDLVPEYFARHAVRPGITGLAQVRGLRGEVADVEHARARVASDLEYIRSFSIWADIRILLATIPAVLIGRAAF
jgi:exopolysaccharide biosynthesis polyprenyl glycosylphosphotransferase